MVTHELKHRVCQISVSIVQKLVPRVGAICIGAKEKLGVTQRRCYVSEDQRFLPLAAPHAYIYTRARKAKVFSSGPIHHHSAQATQIESFLTAEGGRKKERKNISALSSL